MFKKDKSEASIVKRVLYETELKIDEIIRCWLCNRILAVYVKVTHTRTKESVLEKLAIENYYSFNYETDYSHPSWAENKVHYLCLACYKKITSFIVKYVEDINRGVKNIFGSLPDNLNIEKMASFEFSNKDNLLGFIKTHAKVCTKFKVGWFKLPNALKEIFAIHGRCLLKNCDNTKHYAVGLYIPVNTIIKQLKREST